jgi:hypothetical protein
MFSMLFHARQRATIQMIVTALVLLTLCSIGCRSKPQPAIDADADAAGEPENYSATVVRAIDDGAEREMSVTRIARSGEMRREEWVEPGGRRAMIWRPDQGKAFLLDLDARIYVELPFSSRTVGKPEPELPDPASKQTAAGDDISITQSSDAAQRAIDPETIERAVYDAPSPVRVETRWLADQTVENYVCKVSEHRAIYADGHAEVTRMFRALDLAGLAVRIETVAEPQNGSAKIITLRRDIKIDVSPDEFIVPAEFKKVNKLPLK